MTYQEAVGTLYNGNISTFKKWMKTAKKIDILNAIEYAMQEGLYKRHELINSMRIYLET